MERIRHAELASSSLHQVEELLGVLRGRQIDPHAGVVTPKPPHESGHGVRGKSGQAAHTERPGQKTRDRGHRGTTGLEVLECLASRPDQGRARRRQTHAPTGTGEQRCSELTLELLHRKGECGLGDEDGLGRRGETAVVDDSDEVAQAIGID